MTKATNMFSQWSVDHAFEVFYRWWDRAELEKLERPREEMVQMLRAKVAGGVAMAKNDGDLV
jgi:hypothetical protein